MNCQEHDYFAGTVFSQSHQFAQFCGKGTVPNYGSQDCIIIYHYYVIMTTLTSSDALTIFPSKNCAEAFLINQFPSYQKCPLCYIRNVTKFMMQSSFPLIPYVKRLQQYCHGGHLFKAKPRPFTHQSELFHELKCSWTLRTHFRSQLTGDELHSCGTNSKIVSSNVFAKLNTQ